MAIHEHLSGAVNNINRSLDAGKRRMVERDSTDLPRTALSSRSPQKPRAMHSYSRYDTSLQSTEPSMMQAQSRFSMPSKVRLQDRYSLDNVGTGRMRSPPKADPTVWKDANHVVSSTFSRILGITEGNDTSRVDRA